MKTDEEYNDLRQRFIDELERSIRFNKDRLEDLEFAERCLSMLLLVAIVIPTLFLEYALVTK